VAIARKTPAITSTIVAPTFRVCPPSEAMANWAAMTRGSPKFAIARRCASSGSLVASAATTSCKWSSISCRTRRARERSKLRLAASDSA